ncbi:MAG: DNA alkylation repair protein, partial [Rhizobiaceae bacterium]|nr:DNA alkylation repair protein [Hyphomicrobiales bacterium]NRB32530.1 DNA alkylation repair protein [Rhizobiaceae bacterium]
KVMLGEHLEFELDITSDAKDAQPLIVDFVIHYRMANGGTSAKVYKWKNLDLAAGKTVSMAKRFALKQITTRKFYAGQHGFDIQINGETIASDTFELSL